MPPSSSESLRIAVIPDSFKGSVSAADVARAMADGASQAAEVSGTSLDVTAMPFADGGEGTLDAICSAWGISPSFVTATDALGRSRDARFAVSEVGGRVVGVIEAAEANGLPAVSDVELKPKEATTFGVGTLVKAALDAGCEEILLCIGGSATTDGGAGILQALGARLLDSSGREILGGGGPLGDLAAIDLESMDPRAAQVHWRIACDVTNPLVGPDGAAAVFGPQKGASPHDIEVLDRSLGHFAEVLRSVTGRDVRDLAGAGAAGGMPAALVCAFDAEIVAGGVMVAEVLGAGQLLEGADLVLTGEGRLDSQSLHGKVVDTVRRLTPQETPVCVIAGSVEISPVDTREAGLTAAVSIARGPESLEHLRADAPARIREAAEYILRVFISGLGAHAAHEPHTPAKPIRR